MTRGFIVSGTDTGIGKTVFSAMLVRALGAMYWKPVQSGTDGGTDAQGVREMAGIPNDRILPEAYVLSASLSPHRAAEIDGVILDPAAIRPPLARPLVIEGAGGLMVPLTRGVLQIDMFRRWNLPVILCARTALGTINHTLLSVEALRRREAPIHGIAFIGDDNPDNIRTIGDFSGVKVLGRMPRLDHIDGPALDRAFAENFSLLDFAASAPPAPLAATAT
jgi:dethiobiotin synthetase